MNSLLSRADQHPTTLANFADKPGQNPSSQQTILRVAQTQTQGSQLWLGLQGDGDITERWEPLPSTPGAAPPSCCSSRPRCAQKVITEEDLVLIHDSHRLRTLGVTQGPPSQNLRQILFCMRSATQTETVSQCLAVPIGRSGRHFSTHPVLRLCASCSEPAPLGSEAPFAVVICSFYTWRWLPHSGPCFFPSLDSWLCF